MFTFLPETSTKHQCAYGAISGLIARHFDSVNSCIFGKLIDDITPKIINPGGALKAFCVI